VQTPIVVALLGERGGDGHLRHDRRAAAADQTLVEEHNAPGTGARSRDRGVHAGAARADNQHIGVEMDHRGLTPRPRIAAIGMQYQPSRR
jgi:hypothetical protein